MDCCLDNAGQSADLKHGTDSWRLEGCDSNAIILPARKRNKQKGMSQGSGTVQSKKTPLSKSQKRKLKKLEEEKEQAQLLSKSIETLERYKIPDAAYSLLRSSQNIGQVETKLEKRRREMHWSKAGFEVPHCDQHFKSKGVDSAYEMEPDADSIKSRQEFDDNELLEPMIIEQDILNTPVSLGSSQNPVCSSEIGINGGYDAALPAKELSNRGSSIVTQEDMKASSSTPCIRSMDCVDEHQKVDCSTTGDRPQRPPSAAPSVVHVSRPNEVENTRKDLPIVMMEQEIMEAINDNSTVIICGETGCGKTTQLPQFLYEAGFGSNKSTIRRGIIGVTQPRRVAVLSTAKRVAYELGLCLGKEIGFQVRHDKMIGESCSIKFMTDGILLREVQNQFLLNRYSVIILDEAHERSLNTDILIGMLSRIIRERQNIYEQQQKLVQEGKLNPESVIPPLKLILMSATLRVEDFISGRKIFRNPPPVIEVPTRQFPVTVHFSKRTEIVDYIGQAYKKILSIHKRLPPGGILVFVTGQREVEYLCTKLRKASRDLILNCSKRSAGDGMTSVSKATAIDEVDMKEISEAFEIHDQQTDRFSAFDQDLDVLDEDESDFSYDSGTESELDFGDDGDSLSRKTPEDNDNFLDVLGEDGSFASLKAAFKALAGKTTSEPDSKGEQVTPVTSEGCLDQENHNTGKKSGGENSLSAGALCVLPLYAMLPAAAQLRVFEEIEEGERLVVVATNVAETSLTIPGIKYVVDTGREKVKSYNPSNGMEKYEIQWISKASASQRAGRAGRTAPGHCYRLYSSAVFTNMFLDFSAAEISKIPVEGVTLLLKSMEIDKVANFPFPTPPEPSALVEADRCLKTLEALDSKGKLTPLGKAMAHFPMSPRHSRMLLTVIQLMRKVKGYARANLVLGYAVAAAAALSLSNPFVTQFEGSHSNTDGLERDENSTNFDSERIADKQEKLKKKKLKETAKVSRAKFTNPSSDALTVAYALQCFELSGFPVEFCNENALHMKTMEEMSKLRKQLLQLVFNKSMGNGLQQEFSWSHGTMQEVEHAWRVASDKHPLLLNEEELLGQAICAGWADRIAKRSRAISKSSGVDGKASAIRYQASVVKETVFLHRWSSVSRSSPEFLVYSELLHTKRPYMHGATSVKPDWLLKYAGSLCSFSAPLTDPKPYYEPLTDQVLCWVIPTFGPHLWQLPLHSLPISNNEQRVAVFAYVLLEGQVLPCLKSVQKFMAASPGSILRPEASGQERVGNLLNGLRIDSRPIDSCTMLREVWKEKPKKLYLEILGWFQKSFHSHFDFEELWSQMQHEVLLEPQERFPKRGKKEKRRRILGKRARPAKEAAPSIYLLKQLA